MLMQGSYWRNGAQGDSMCAPQCGRPCAGFNFLAASARPWEGESEAEPLAAASRR